MYPHNTISVRGFTLMVQMYLVGSGQRSGVQMEPFVVTSLEDQCLVALMFFTMMTCMPELDLLCMDLIATIHMAIQEVSYWMLLVVHWFYHILWPTTTDSLLQPLALMVMLGWLAEQGMTLKGELRCVQMANGAQCVTTAGAMLMLRWSAGNSTSQQLVCNTIQVAWGNFYHETLGLAVFYGGTYGQGIGPINLDDVACSGSEASLSCTYDSNTADCTHAQDAGVRCHSCKSLCLECTFSIISPTANPPWPPNDNIW